MPDFQFNSFPINATPLADVSENTNADGVLVVRNGAVQKVPKASAAHAIGALDSTDLEPYVPKTTKVNGNPLSGDVTATASQIPYVSSVGLESDNVNAAIDEAVGFLSEAHETSLYVNAGTSSAAGNYALSGDIDDYDFLDIYTSFSGLNEIRRIPVDPGQSYSIRFLNLADTDTSTFVGWSEISLSFSDAVMTVNHNKYVNWSGKVNSDAVVATSGKPYILKVMGIKYDLIGTQGGGGGSATWGTIGGTLSNQTDLQSALNAKIAAPNSPTTGQFLSWNGSAWVAASLPVYNGGVS